MQKKLTRKDFLVNSSKAAVGLTAVAGLSSLVTTASLKANPAFTWPYPWQNIDPDLARVAAHNLYWNGKDCCSGAFGGIVEPLASAMGEPWASFPIEIMLYGRGGGAGWGSLCGCINGGAALISLVTDKVSSGPLITELWGWYTQAELPTDTANQFAVNGQYLVHNYDELLPQNVSGSPLCHVSVTEWCLVANKKISDVERKERCARVTGDCAAKTVEILNAHFNGTFTSTYVDPASVTACLGCHGTAFMNNVMTKMDCVQCHGDNPHPTSVDTLPGSVSSFQLSQNYPNPFNPSTKLRFSVPQSEKVRIEIFDIRGKLINTLVDYELYQPGNYEVSWHGNDSRGSKVASGIYFARMTAGKFIQTQKMSLVK